MSPENPDPAPPGKPRGATDLPVVPASPESSTVSSEAAGPSAPRPERAKPFDSLTLAQRGRVEGEVPHSVCLQCGCEMNLIKTKWVCPECHWIIGCCD